MAHGRNHLRERWPQVKRLQENTDNERLLAYTSSPPSDIVHAVTSERITNGMTAEQRLRYSTLMHSIISQAEAAIPKGVPAEEVGRVIADAITSKRPRTRYAVGREAALLPLLAILPDRMLDRVLAAALRPHFPMAGK